MSDDGNAVKYEGRSNMKATQDALRENRDQKILTHVESNASNVNSGAKKNLDNDDKATLLKKRKTVKK
jgi:hypothetical protein